MLQHAELPALNLLVLEPDGQRMCADLLGHEPLEEHRVRRARGDIHLDRDLVDALPTEPLEQLDGQRPSPIGLGTIVDLYRAPDLVDN